MPVTDDLLSPNRLTLRDMPFVAFKTETIEDAKRTKETGRMAFKDQAYAIITPPGGKSNNIERVDDFFTKMEHEVQVGRVHPDWVRKWRGDYELYQKGQEIPLDGTPIRGWKLLSGSQQEELTRLNILTVEALANLTDEGARNVGMGAVEFRRRAQAWLAQNEAHEGGAVQLTSLKRENDELKGTVSAMQEKLDELEKALASKRKG